MISEIEHYTYLDIKKVISYYNKSGASIWQALEHEKFVLNKTDPYDDVRVDINYTQNKFGIRPWLVCPICSRRCTKLYSLHRKLKCRICHKLKYSSCSRHREHRYENFIKPLWRFYKVEKLLECKMRIEKRKRLVNEYNELLNKLSNYRDKRGGYYRNFKFYFDSLQKKTV